MIFWDQYKDNIEDEDEENKSSSDNNDEDDNKKEKKEDKKSSSNSSSAPTSKPPAKTVDAEFEGFEEKSETSLPDSSTPSSTKKLKQIEAAPATVQPSKFKSLFGKNKGGGSSGGNGGGSGDDGTRGGKNPSSVPNWKEDLFESVITQRNILFFFTIICVLAIAMSVLLIRYVKSSQTIEPFVIEIEQKSGIPTVVTPVSTRVYSTDEAIKRYFIMKYIRAREEYFPSTFQDNFFSVVRVLSSSAIYYNDYRPKFSISNPNSPYNIYGESSNRRVVLKSLIFQSPKTAQVRIAFEVNGIVSLTQNKIILMDFDFANIEMNDDERFINPLGFQVTFYRIEDESV